MHGVSEVIAIILILMITISLAGLAYMFMSTTMSDVTASAGSAVDTTTSSMLTSFTIESISQNHVYVRNTGQNALTGLSVYIEDQEVNYTAPTSIPPGSVGEINITSIIFAKDQIRVTSSNGISATKPAPTEWYGTVGYWKFDEGSGTTTYDSSPNANTGTLVSFNFNSASGWTTGMLGNGLIFDGSNDYVNCGNASGLTLGTGSFSIGVWIKFPINGSIGWDGVVAKGFSTSIPRNTWGIARYSTQTNQVAFQDVNDTSGAPSAWINSGALSDGWHYITATRNANSYRMYVDGAQVDFKQTSSIANLNSTDNLMIGRAGGRTINGTIDEVAIWNRTLTAQEIVKLYRKTVQ